MSLGEEIRNIPGVDSVLKGGIQEEWAFLEIKKVGGIRPDTPG